MVSVYVSRILRVAHCAEAKCPIMSQKLKVLLAPDESVATFLRTTRAGVHVAFDVQLTSQSLRSTEENSTLARVVNLANRSEDHIPVRSTEIGGCTKASNGISVAAVEHDVGGVSCRNLGREILFCVSDVHQKKGNDLRHGFLWRGACLALQWRGATT